MQAGTRVLVLPDVVAGLGIPIPDGTYGVVGDDEFHGLNWVKFDRPLANYPAFFFQDDELEAVGQQPQGPPPAALTAIKSVLQRTVVANDAVVFDNHASNNRQVLYVARPLDIELGCPDQITVTLQPGDEVTPLLEG